MFAFCSRPFGVWVNRMECLLCFMCWNQMRLAALEMIFLADVDERAKKVCEFELDPELIRVAF